MKTAISITIALLFNFLGSLAAEDLPFDRNVINRYSLDGIPRSISIRQGEDVWLGYDLERATPCKVWKAPDGKSGLTDGLTPKSIGEAMFEDRSEDGWKLLGAEKAAALKIRYLGCTQREGHFELSWEFQLETRTIILRERISTAAEAEDSGVSRELQVEGLNSGESLALPAGAGATWQNSAGQPVNALTKNNKWTQAVLP